MKYLDPKADLTFKKIFGNHPNRLKNLLNSLQSLNEDELIQHEGKEEGRAEGRAEGTNFFHLCLANSDFLRNLAAQNVKHVGIWQK